MNGIDQASVIPVLDHVVWAIVDLNFNGVSTIVDEENDGPLSTSQHCWHILSSHLSGIQQGRLRKFWNFLGKFYYCNGKCWEILATITNPYFSYKSTSWKTWTSISNIICNLNGRRDLWIPGNFRLQYKQWLASQEQPVHTQELLQQTNQLIHIAFGIHTCKTHFPNFSKNHILDIQKASNTIIWPLFTRNPLAILASGS